jgi:hypothetical protein
LTQTRTRKSTSTKKVQVTKVERLEPNLKMADYLADFKVRLQIHNQEVESLIEDIKKGYQKLQPKLVVAYDYLKKAIDRVQTRFA